MYWKNSVKHGGARQKEKSKTSEDINGYSEGGCADD